MIQPKAILLDVGGVFVAPDPTMLRSAIPELATAEDDRLVRAHYAGAAALDGCGMPQSWGAYCTAFLLEAGVPVWGLRDAIPVLHDRIQARPNMWSYVLPGSVEALKALAATGIELAIVSNSDGTVEQVLRENGICQVGEGDGTCVTVVVDSHMVGIEKPDPQIFLPALHALGIGPDDAIYVGDTVHADVDGARAAGIEAIHMDPYGFCGAEDHAHVESLAELVDLLR